jgi:Fe2+ or Zn2+ uptake regulation protein
MRAPFSSSISTGGSSTRDALVSIIGMQPGLSCAQLTKIIRKARNDDISQQAVFKTLNIMVEEGVLFKEDKKYALNQTWITKAKTFLVQAEERSKQSTEAILLI